MPIIAAGARVYSGEIASGIVKPHVRRDKVAVICKRVRQLFCQIHVRAARHAGCNAVHIRDKIPLGGFPLFLREARRGEVARDISHTCNIRPPSIVRRIVPQHVMALTLLPVLDGHTNFSGRNVALKGAKTVVHSARD